MINPGLVFPEQAQSIGMDRRNVELGFDKTDRSRGTLRHKRREFDCLIDDIRELLWEPWIMRDRTKYWALHDRMMSLREHRDKLTEDSPWGIPPELDDISGLI